MSARTKRHRAPIRCLTGFRWHAPADAEFGIDETKIEKLLERAKASGLVTEYDTGRGRVVWFNAAAGVQARRLKREIEDLLPDDWTRGESL